MKKIVHYTLPIFLSVFSLYAYGQTSNHLEFVLKNIENKTEENNQAIVNEKISYSSETRILGIGILRFYQ